MDEDETPETIHWPKVYQHNHRNTIVSSKVTMPSTSKSKSKRKKAKKYKFVPKPKQVWRVKQPTRNWLELPSDIMADILYRIGVIDILENAQKVCTTWRKICKEPSMWRVIKMNNFSDPSETTKWQKMCKIAVDRSQGQLVDLSVSNYCTNKLLQCIFDRSSQLRRLEFICCYYKFNDFWSMYLKTLPLLEELSLNTTLVLNEDIENVGRYCPMLKTLKLNQNMRYYNDAYITIWNQLAVTIGKNLHELRHLELVSNTMSNIGLLAILDGCPHLETLDLRRCLNLDLTGDLGKRCSKQIKYLKFPHDSVEGLAHCYENANYRFDDSDDDNYLDYDNYEDYDDYTAFHNITDSDDLSDMLALMALMR